MKNYLPGLEEKLDLETRLGDACELVKSEQPFSAFSETDSQVHENVLSIEEHLCLTVLI